jgi:phosphoglycolate phosphatase-like HAD superfamily hydrolase
VHIVWDWNGTLLDDFLISVKAADLALQQSCGVQVSEELYRYHFTRPVRRFYENLLGRTVSEQEWRQIAEEFHAHYGLAVQTAGLRPGAAELLELIDSRGITQSMLSMGEHDELVPLVRRHDLSRWFLLVRGSERGKRTESKRTMLAQHLKDLSGLLGAPVPPDSALMIGDSFDDAVAARELGMRCVLLSDGLFNAAELAALGFPAAPDLRAAVEEGLGTELAGYTAYDGS